MKVWQTEVAHSERYESRPELAPVPSSPQLPYSMQLENAQKLLQHYDKDNMHL